MGSSQCVSVRSRAVLEGWYDVPHEGLSVTVVCVVITVSDSKTFMSLHMFTCEVANKVNKDFISIKNFPRAFKAIYFSPDAISI